jgi:ribosomal RNA-processing protein 17
MAPPVSKKRKLAVTAPEKIEFDFSAREEYLTGFHKRKVARIKHAQEENAKREKEEKLRFRREVRAILTTYVTIPCRPEQRVGIYLEQS